MKAKYALRALSTLARYAPERLLARKIAVDAGVPEKFLEAILVELRNANLIETKRGAAGGHSLARSADLITIGDIVRVIDGPIAPLRCASVTAYKPCDECIDPQYCALRYLMGDVRDAMSSVIDNRSLQQLSDENGRLTRQIKKQQAREQSRMNISLLNKRVQLIVTHSVKAGVQLN